MPKLFEWVESPVSRWHALNAPYGKYGVSLIGDRWFADLHDSDVDLLHIGESDSLAGAKQIVYDHILDCYKILGEWVSAPGLDLPATACRECGQDCERCRVERFLND